MFQRIQHFALSLTLCGVASMTFGCGSGPTTTPEDALTSAEKAALRGSRTLLIVKNLVTEAHRIYWSAPLRERAEQCDKPTRAEVLACLDPYLPDTNEKIVVALQAYEAAATLAGNAIVSTSEDGPSIKSSILTLTQSALSVVGMIPQASTIAATLNGILGSL